MDTSDDDTETMTLFSKSQRIHSSEDAIDEKKILVRFGHNSVKPMSPNNRNDAESFYTSLYGGSDGIKSATNSGRIFSEDRRKLVNNQQPLYGVFEASSPITRKQLSITTTAYQTIERDGVVSPFGLPVNDSGDRETDPFFSELELRIRGGKSRIERDGRNSGGYKDLVIEDLDD